MDHQLCDQTDNEVITLPAAGENVAGEAPVNRDFNVSVYRIGGKVLRSNPVSTHLSLFSYPNQGCDTSLILKEHNGFGKGTINACSSRTLNSFLLTE